MLNFPDSINKVIVTGGSGFIGGTLIRKLLTDSGINIFNLDKMGYASNTDGITEYISNNNIDQKRYQLINVDLSDKKTIEKAIRDCDPDLVFHLAAESHVDRSIDGPTKFVQSNIIGTFNLLEALLKHWLNLPPKRRNSFLLLHISTDEVFGSLENKSLFNEESLYKPNNPYSATKAASDHLVRAWHQTYNIPTIITNCSNNYGPWQFPEKLIPLTIYKAMHNLKVPIYGDGQNVRDWIYVDDHVDALIKLSLKGKIGHSYCIGGEQQKTNEEIIDTVCDLLDIYNKKNSPHRRFKDFVKDRLGHDRIYGLNNKKIKQEIGWYPKIKIEEGLELTVKWYLSNLEWCTRQIKK